MASSRSPTTALVTLGALGVLLWLAGCERVEAFGNYYECRDALCGGNGKNCGQCMSGAWKSAAGGAKQSRKRGDDGGDDGGGGGWKKGARITCFNDTAFAGSGVDSSRLAAVHEKDWSKYKDAVIEVRWPGGKTKTVEIKDYCDKKDASCNNVNDSDANFLIDVHEDSVPSGVQCGCDPCWAVGDWRVVSFAK